MQRRLPVIALIIFALVSAPIVLAQEGANNTSDEIYILNVEIDQKQGVIDQLNRQINSYKTKITQKQAEAVTLQDEIDLLENRVAKTELDIKTTQTSIELTNAQIALLGQRINEQEQALTQQHEMISDVLQEIQVSHDSLGLQILFGSQSFSELFDELERLERVSTDLKTAAEQSRTTREGLNLSRTDQVTKKNQLVSHENALRTQWYLLEEEQGAKVVLVEETQQSEAEFRSLLSELKEEQTYINQQVLALQTEIEGRLAASDELGDLSALSWPLNPSGYGISARFHDPTYPFRHLFEHSGLDLPSPSGTPVGSAAPGYVAWTRQGRMYGNYVMVIHAGGLATLYAHLSSVNVVADQFVSRGQQIGSVGSTGFSTGPHLHFEVRKNGIPTNPQDHLISY